ncbi:MAG TPA: Ig-like domain-containing protein, partial [Gemmataceae bacterium]|nr:Ig-like domain-containing protein [Gemmataceae bacterium]
FTVTGNPAHGTLSGTAPSLTYTPAAGYFGTDSFQFTDSNGTATSAAASVSITVVGQPTANAQSVSALQDTPANVTLTASDPNSPPKALSFTVTVNPAHGTLSGTAPNLTFTPAAGYFGADSFKFTATNGVATSVAATISITVVGKPTADAQTVTVPQDTATAVTLTGSDPNTPALPLTFAVTVNPSHGTLSGTAPNLTYTPAAGYFGPDSFQFTDNNGQLTSAAATVSITDVGKPTANVQAVTVPQDTATGVTLTGSDPNSPPRSLTFTVTVNPSHGTLSGTAPSLTYTPAAGYFGPDSFQFTVNNGVLTSAAATVSITDVGKPTANAQAVTVPQDTATAVTLTGSDPNTPPLKLTFTVSANPSHGTVSGTAPNLTYTPAAGYFGPDSFQFTVSNGVVTSAAATVTITDVGKPTANAQTVTVPQDTATAVTLTGSDPNTPPLGLTFTVSANPSHGTLSGTAPNLTYTPAAGYFGADSFQFTVNNGVVTSVAAVVSINDVGQPTANAQAVTVAQDTASAITLTGSDPNTPPRSLTFSVTVNPTNGTLSGTAPNLTYTPNAGYFGADSFQFTVNNGVLTSAAATVSITDVGKPTANAQAVTVPQDTATAVTLTGSDPNTPPRTLTFTVTANPSHGTLSGTAPNLTYTPAAGYFGADSFQFTVSNGVVTSAAATVTITDVGQPTANAQTVTVPQDTATAITLTGSDPNTPPRTLTFTVSANPSHGTLSGTAPNLTYTPGVGYSGADSFQFTVSNGVVTSTAATVTITDVGQPTANAQTVTVAQDTATAITLTGSDPNTPPRTLTFTVTANPSHGTLSGTAPNLTYTPAAGYFGADSFQFTVNNGVLTSAAATVSITDVGQPTANAQAVTVPQDTATAVTLTGSDPNTPPRTLTFTVTANPGHGTLSGTAPNLTYTPAAGYFGADSFQFTVSNGVVTSAAATVAITDVGKPTANAQSVNVPQDTATGVTLTGSDPNTPPLALTFTVTANPSHGTLSGTAPNLTYTPAAGYFGPDSFQFTVNNGVLTSAAATISITDIGKPSANSQSQSTGLNTAANITLTGSDPQGQTLSFTISANPGHGTLSGFNASTGAVTYTPDTGFVGTDTFQFTVTNTSNLTSSAATVSVAVKQATISGDVAVAWGSQTASLATATDGLRLLPAGRKTDIPWMNVKSIQVTLSQATTLTAADVTVSGVNVANYGPVTVSGSGTSFTITFAAPIAKADRVTVTISNATIATFTRRLDILPGDFKDQGYVDIADVVAILIASRRAYDPFADINGDGKVDSSGPNSDVALARLLIGTKLP